MSQRASISWVSGPTVAPTRPRGIFRRIPHPALSPRGEGSPGEVHAVDEDVLEVGMRGERDVLDAPRQSLRPRALGLGHEGELGAQRGRIAHVADARLGQRGDEADAERAPDREVVAETAREHELGHVVVADAGHAEEHGRARGDGALAELHLADVVLGEDDLAARRRARPAARGPPAAPPPASPRARRAGRGGGARRPRR